MYAQLTYDPNLPLPWTVDYSLSRDLAPPALSVPEGLQRAAVVNEIVKKVGETQKGPNHLELMNVARGLPLGAEDVEHDLYMALAHLRLPEPQRKKREARIDQILDLYLSGTPKSVPKADTGKEHIKRMAQLAPDAVLEGIVRSQAARLPLNCLEDHTWFEHFAPQIEQIQALGAALDVGQKSPEQTLLFNAALSRPPAERDEFYMLLRQAVQRKLSTVIRATCAALKGQGLLPAFEGDVLAHVLKECVAVAADASPAPDIQRIVTTQVELGSAEDVMRTQAVLAATVAAIKAQVPFGDKVDAKNKMALTLHAQILAQQALNMTPQRLRLRKKLATQAANTDKSKNTAKAAAPADLDSVGTWSVKSLLRWIQGPIADANPQPLDTKAIVVQEKAARQEARAKTKSKPLPKDEDLTEDDVQGAIQDALNTSAEFALWELNGMLQRLQDLQVAKTPVAQTCEKMVDSLNELIHRPYIDEQNARILLQQAQVVLKQLAAEVKAEEIDARTRQRFLQSLQLALSKETMVEGKRNGGVIACPMKRSHWQGVHDDVHDRWLPWIRHVKIDGQTVALPDDMALALYVTQTSLSGYEFDISVHLWQRRRGRTGAPTTTGTPFAPMNTEEWHDTLVPFAVLHVPSAH